MYLLFCLVFAFVVIHLVSLAGAQRATFGESAGDILLSVEVATVVAVWMIGWLWSRKQRRLALAFGFIGAAALLAFIGWFVQPEKQYDRALDRVFSSEHALNNYRFEQQYSSDPPEKASLRLRRLNEELAARKLELGAAEVRFNGEPLFFMSHFNSWLLWIDALILTVCGILVLKLFNNALEIDAR